jgi:hypothetical protein
VGIGKEAIAEARVVASGVVVCGECDSAAFTGVQAVKLTAASTARRLMRRTSSGGDGGGAALKATALDPPRRGTPIHTPNGGQFKRPLGSQ